MIVTPDFVHLDDIVIKWALDFPLDKSQIKEADDILPDDINWKHFQVHHSETEYLEETSVASPKSHVLFGAYFTNNTDQSQVYALNTSRKTQSTCALSISKGYMIGASVDIKLMPPNPIISANAGFSGQLKLDKGTNETFVEELSWSANNQITVPPRFKTKAELIIREDVYDGHFKAESKFEGRISVTLRSKKDNTPLTTITGEVKQIFTQDKGFRVDKSGTYLVTRGRCKCRFGIEQHVRLSQFALVGNELENN